MAKLQAPKTSKTESPETEGVQAPDLSGLIAGLTEKAVIERDSTEAADNALVDMIVELHEARAEHGEAVSRDDIRLALQTAFAEANGLKLVEVQNKPEKPGPTASKETIAKAKRRNSLYTLVSQMLSAVWPKDEKIDASVQKLVKEGERRFTVLIQKSRKKQSRPEQDPDAKKITKENFAAKLNLFLTQAQSDTGLPLEEIFELTEIALEAMKTAPKE